MLETQRGAKVAIFENNPDQQDQIILFLEEAGHEVVATAETVFAALALVPQLTGLGVQVATLDGNLSPNATGGAEGLEILAAIKQQAPLVKVIGLSNGSIEGVDFDLGKLHAAQLPAAVKFVLGSSQ